MKKILKTQKGIAAIAVILIIVLSAAAGGTTFLGVRALITGEPFLQPFEDAGLIELEEKKEDKEKESKDKNKTSENEELEDADLEDDETSTEDIVSEKGEQSSLLVEEINDNGVECYTIVIDLKEVADGIIPIVEDLITLYTSVGVETGTDVELSTVQDAISELLDVASEIFTDCEIVLDCYANGNDIKQLLITFKYEPLVKNIYNKMSDMERIVKEIDPTADLGIEYDSYESYLADFEAGLEEVFSTETIRTALSEELDEEYSEIINTAEVSIEDKKIQISFNLSSIKIDTFIMNYRTELEELGIDPDNFVESVVNLWNETVEEVGYDTLINELYSTVIGTYNMFSY